jgi:hypothetical protein
MKTIAYLLMFGLILGTPMVYAQDEAEPEKTEEVSEEQAEPEVDEKALKKAANKYWSTKMARKKKAVGILKKVKDEKSAKKAGKNLAKLYNLTGKKKDAPKPEDSEYMEAAEKRFQSHIEKLDEAIDEEVKRIEELGSTAMGDSSNDDIMTEELRKGIEAAKK